MNRSGSLLGGGVLVVPAMLEPPRHWGRVDIARHASLCARGIWLRVYANGEDVTRRCRWFDDTPGAMRAELIRRGPDGRVALDADRRPVVDVVRDFIVRPGHAWETHGCSLYAVH